MNLLNAWVVGLKEIWAHKFRSLLTMMGIVLGVASLVGMSALVQGMENGMKESLVAIGGLEKVRVEPKEIPSYQRHLADQAKGLTVEDVYALQNSAPLLRTVVPEMSPLVPLHVTQGARQVEWAYVLGTWNGALDMMQHTVQHGRMVNPLDENMAWNVCVIGANIRDQLFGSEEEMGREVIPLGEFIQLNGQPFRVIGVFQRYESEQERKRREIRVAEGRPVQSPAGGTAGDGRNRRGGGGGGTGWVFELKNNTIYIPLRTMHARFRISAAAATTTVPTGSSDLQLPLPDPHLSALSIKVKDIDQMDQALQQVRNVLLLHHRRIDDFTFNTKEDWSEQIGTAIKNARITGGFISAISLLVGGIGIMNIMLASITERIREIGIRKAVGAGGPAIFVQILVESTVVALIGGVAGLLVSFAVVDALVVISPTGNTPVISVRSLAIAFFFSAVVGVVAGIFPAAKAARLNPIQALRYD